jgi:DNA-binding NarL/FixJ family response regulator
MQIPSGLPLGLIASHLNLSEQTVKNHVHRIMRRIGANDRLQVIDQARFWGVLQYLRGLVSHNRSHGGKWKSAP